MEQFNIEWKDIASVKPYARNAKKHNETQKPVELSCAIGDDTIDGKPYAEVVEIARAFIKDAADLKSSPNGG